MSRPVRLSPAEVQSALDLRRQGLSCVQAAERMGRSASAVSRACIRAAAMGQDVPVGHVAPSGRRRVIDRDAVLAMRNEGLRMSEIAAKTGWSVPGLRKVIDGARAEGVEVRSVPVGRPPLNPSPKA